MQRNKEKKLHVSHCDKVIAERKFALVGDAFGFCHDARGSHSVGLPLVGLSRPLVSLAAEPLRTCADSRVTASFIAGSAPVFIFAAVVALTFVT